MAKQSPQTPDIDDARTADRLTLIGIVVVGVLIAGAFALSALA